MQPIQDKDFDQLFKNAFEDAEVSPSKDFWSNIEGQIEPKKKLKLPVYWLVAAMALIIATVGILVYQQQDVKPKQYVNNVASEIKKTTIIQNAVKDSSSKLISPLKESLPQITVQTKVVSTFAKNRKEIQIVEKQKVITAPEMQKQETMIANVLEPKKDIKTKIEEAVAMINDATITAAIPQRKAGEVIGENEQAESKGIRNVGDVVNLIVNKVDKRKDKFIQFRTDDDDSSLSVLNIGPFKFGKRNKK